MTRDDPFDRLIAEAEAAPFEGWNFSYLAGRIDVSPEPWDYRARVDRLLADAEVALDMGTGGGEFVASLDRRPPVMVATEAWMPNVPVAARNLRPIGVYVVADEGAPDNATQPADGGRLPFRAARFDAIINRHDAFVPEEVSRVLRPGGRFLTQQVGGENEIELNEALDAGPPGASPTLDAYVAQLEAAGLHVLVAQEAKPRKRYLDVGAIAYNVRAFHGQFTDLDRATLRDRLREIHRHIQTEGTFDVHHHRLLIEAEKR